MALKYLIRSFLIGVVLKERICLMGFNDTKYQHTIIG